MYFSPLPLPPPPNKKPESNTVLDLKYLVISETGGFNGGIYWVSMGKATIPILPLATYCYILLTALAEYSIFIFIVLVATYFLAKKNYTNVRYF